MAVTLFVLSAEPRSGATLTSLGIVSALAARTARVAFFKPVAEADETGTDPDIRLLLEHFGLDQTLESAFALDRGKAALLTSSGRRDEFLECVASAHAALAASHDVVVCEAGAVRDGGGMEFELGLELAGALGASVVAVVSGLGRDADRTAEAARLAEGLVAEKNLTLAALAVNRVAESDAAAVSQSLSGASAFSGPPPPVWVIPEDPRLSRPSLAEIAAHLSARILWGADRLDVQAGETVVAAMSAGNFLSYVRPECLVVTPGDRADIILAVLAARMSGAFPHPAGLALTGGIAPAATIGALLGDWADIPMPVLLVDTPTYPTLRRLESLASRLRPEEPRRVQAALGHFESRVDVASIQALCSPARTDAIPGLVFEQSIIARARGLRKTIVFPEGGEDRVLRAAEQVLARGIARVIILGDVDDIRRRAAALGLDIAAAQVFDPAGYPDREAFAQTLFTLRRDKGLTLEAARELLADKTYFGTMLVYKGLADGMVSGATTTTADTIRPALQFIRTRPGFSIVSSVFFMCLKDRVLVYGDCAVNPNPTAAELAEIAVASAQTAARFGIAPRVAMLSYSTGASGKGPGVDKVREAVELAKKRIPDIPVEGPIQYDAAIDPATAAEKMPGSLVAGRATVFVFPDLDTGNTTYKAVQRSSGAAAMGPVLQGLRKPVNDLSRGCTVRDIVYTAAVTVIQAGQDGGEAS
ncbi:phosphate acetyltransferase [Desulfolutivibrio sulfoxidireducens]|uniref:phosphate acetyltransferase n=1 Tax=Desulfolutivibrio sulfoxidireducens TaxID=2773299 RepID=UPI00159D84A6|nr:phosphate acetyltransferase [Desulfolutivibrio sulfoxidireducens]QLA19526.1 phosphate acetyltransferase [Desulfolutivibrio sulfoxidireducens]